MKTFIIKCILFFFLVTSIVTYVLVFYGGYVDYFYNKFTTPKASSMIFGDSRSLQGIQPRIINNYFSESEVELPILNYSFTLGQIAYGEPYFNSIKKKLNSTTKKGLFILTVHPFTLSNRDTLNKTTYFEKDMPPHNMEYVDVSPNYEYLIKNFNYFHFRGIFRKSSNTHKDGWMEEKNLPNDSLVLKKWKKGQIKLYTKFSNQWSKSEIRLNDLKKLINYLKQNGDIFLVRLPIDKELVSIENKYWPSFDYEMNNISKKYSINYINFCKTENFFKTYDGIHIDKFSGAEYTKILCDSISKYLIK